MQGILGVGPLDAMLGKVPDHARILITCEPDVDGRALLLQAARNALREGHEVVYVVTDRSPSGVRRAVARLGQQDQDGLHFIDAYSGLLGAPADQPLQDPADLDALISHLLDAADDHPGALLCIESVSSLVDRSQGAFAEVGRRLLDAMNEYSGSLGLFISWPNLPDVSRFLSRFDGGLQFYGIEKRIVRNNALKVEHLSWVKKPDQRPRLVTVRADGGIRVLVPKVAVTGPENAGKTTFVNHITTGAVGTERMATTVALDKGRYESEGIEAEVFGTPGQPRFDPIINTLLEQAAAVILLVDATNKDSLPRAKELLARVQRRGLRVVVAANKQDIKGAMSTDELAEHLGVPTIGCTATDKASAQAVMEAALQGVLTEEVAAP